jgi:20S proteasome alpha/beta subunit
MKKYSVVILFLTFFITSHLTATIVVLISTYDGFVISADSRLILQKGGRMISDSYQKIIRVGYDSGIGFSGAAQLIDLNGQPRNIGSLIEAFKIQKDINDETDTTPKEITEGLKSFFEKIYEAHLDNAKLGIIEMLVFGYDHNDRKIYILRFPLIDTTSQPNKVIGVFNEIYPSGVPGSFVLGQQEVWHRLIKGYDPLIDENILSQGLKDSIKFNVQYGLMSLQDGIDFATFITRATIESNRFDANRIMGVGGDIDIAVITINGFEWVRKKSLNVSDAPIKYLK